MRNEKKKRVCTLSFAVLGEKPKDYGKKGIWEMQIIGVEIINLKTEYFNWEIVDVETECIAYVVWDKTIIQGEQENLE